jgi:alkanesulfonate monooxygenase SsuD/methylene tetrahydromethanopterin reductase-like flavin-dependent oxidoreductase (luciferase family)
MAASIGYLLPTRERVMEGHPEAKSLLALAERAEGLGYDSIWVGDSLLARPRHDPLTLLAAVAARTRRAELGTAVLLPALRNPVVLAQQVATLDQIAEGRVILGIGIASDVPNIRAEFAAAGVPFEKRVGTLMEGMRLCRALWTGEKVDWEGRWPVKGAVLGPTPHRAGGPPIWIGGSVRASLERIAKYFDGWFPNHPGADWYAAQWHELKTMARAAGRDPAAIAGAAYLTLSLDDNAARANERLDRFLGTYYGQSPAEMRARQACFAGAPAEGAAWVRSFVEAGASHLCLRFTGDHERHLETVAKLRAQIG